MERLEMRLALGIFFWLAGLALLIWSLRSTDQPGSNDANSQLSEFLLKSRQNFEMEFEFKSVLRVGDPIIAMEGETAKVVGSVISVSDEPTTSPRLTDSGSVQFYSSLGPIREGDYLTHHQTPSSMDWVVQMMLPPYRRQEISNLIAEAYRQHYAEISDALQPILLKSIKDAADVIRNDFYRSIQKREDQIRKLGDRYQVELVEEQLIPLIKDEIWPIVQEATKPLAIDIGEEMFEHASVWRFGWRILYDSSPLPERNLVKKEFERFMNKYGIPVIEAHLPELLEVQQVVLKRVSENSKVKQVMSETSMKILRDPEFQDLTTDVLRDIFVDNDKLTAVFEDNWNSPDARRALDITNQKLDPTITRIGQALFGSPEQSITPEFSRILRNRILHKDERWLVLHRNPVPGSSLSDRSRIKVRPGQTGTENPFHVPARTKF